jgi:hypothetical protein
MKCFFASHGCEILIKKSALFFLLLACPFYLKSVLAGSQEFIGASGITRHGSDLLIVWDKGPGAYYRYPLRELPKGPLIPIDVSLLQPVPLAGASLSLDLEGVDVLADGRVVAVSESLSALVSEKESVAQYGGPFSELAGIGIEGIAVRHLEGEVSRVAVVWEGGYPEHDKVPFQLRGMISKAALKPVMLIHDIRPNEICGKIRMNEMNQIELKVPVPKGEEPLAQRYRVPDLVWHKWKHQGIEEWGFIALLSSRNLAQTQEYLYDELLRFNIQGEPVGKVIDLNELLPKELHGLNWEGLGWYEEGKSVVLIYDNSRDQKPFAYVVNLPEDWK